MMSFPNRDRSRTRYTYNSTAKIVEIHNILLNVEIQFTIETKKRKKKKTIANNRQHYGDVYYEGHDWSIETK